MASVPMTIGELDEAKEIKDFDEDGEGGIENFKEGTINNESINEMSKEDAAPEEEKDDIIDPEDPLYGLEQRLKYANLDDDTKAIIKQKLAQTKERIHEQLEQRQHNLDSKL
jgi:hypothetical protein